MAEVRRWKGARRNVHGGDLGAGALGGGKSGSQEVGYRLLFFLLFLLSFPSFFSFFLYTLQVISILMLVSVNAPRILTDAGPVKILKNVPSLSIDSFLLSSNVLSHRSTILSDGVGSFEVALWKVAALEANLEGASGRVALFF